jgi:MFS family permease
VAGVLAVTLLRGVGFGIITVGFAALIVELAPPERRGEALGLFGVAMTLPTIFSNPLGLWLVDASATRRSFSSAASSPSSPSSPSPASAPAPSNARTWVARAFWTACGAGRSCAWS